MEFKNKIVIVTGGAGGLGKGISKRFVQLGAEVVCADLDPVAGKTLVSETSGFTGAIHFVQGDMALASTCDKIANMAKQLGGVDVLCNNVGIQPPSSYVPADELPEQLWDSILNVNLKSCFRMVQRCIPLIRQRNGGVIINTASVQGFQSMKGVAAYAASKGGIIALTKQLALEYAADNIRVLAVAPGTFDTPLLQEVQKGVGDKEYIHRMRAAYPLQRFGQIDELASVVTFLAGPGASFMTGECVTVDGGIMAKGGWA